MALEDGEWQKANDFFEQALNIDPQKAEAYLGVAMGKAKAHSREEYLQKFDALDFEPDKAFARVRQFAQGNCGAGLETVQECMNRQRRGEWPRKKRGANANGLSANANALSMKNALRKWKEVRKKISPARALISAGGWHTVGSKSDGMVMAVGDNRRGQCYVDEWTDIRGGQCRAASYRGLKPDGTVAAVGDNDFGRCDVKGWTDIVAVSAGGYHTVGLKRDGTVVAVGWNKHSQCDVADWTDIVAVSAGGWPYRRPKVERHGSSRRQ